jgi:hypothetical protein
MVSWPEVVLVSVLLLFVYMIYRRFTWTKKLPVPVQEPKKNLPRPVYVPLDQVPRVPSLKSLPSICSKEDPIDLLSGAEIVESGPVGLCWGNFPYGEIPQDYHKYQHKVYRGYKFPIDYWFCTNGQAYPKHPEWDT